MKWSKLAFKIIPELAVFFVSCFSRWFFGSCLFPFADLTDGCERQGGRYSDKCGENEGIKWVLDEFLICTILPKQQP